ncbi:MAG TPA: heme-binding protein [Stellaceae bacterium]|nr:heme-binding protein [Stellaceae bacterium]
MRTRPTLTSEDAHKMMNACKAEAQKNKWAVSIAIVDDAGTLLLFERLDGASPTTAAVSQGKALTSVALRRPSKFMEDRLKDRPAFLKFPAGIPIQGAVPVMYQGECVGAIGVSGVQSHEDEQVASAGAATIA